MADTHVNVFINEFEDAAKHALTAVSGVKSTFDNLYTQYGTQLKDKEAKAVQDAHDAATKAVADLKAEIDKIRAKYEPEVAEALEADAEAAKAEEATTTDQSTDKKTAKK